jgi:hypothetical protein
MKYNRTPHLPWSPGGTSDDKRMLDVSGLLHVPIIITEKLDGSNVCMEAKSCYARSHSDAPKHPSFDVFKSLHATVRHLIPESIQVFGEWLYARHSISYTALPHYFQIFGVRNLDTKIWASWEEVELWANELNIPIVPVLFTNIVSSEKELRNITETLAAQPSICGGEREGVVVRKAGEFADAEFANSVGKIVRENHVQTSEHWKNQIIVQNKLKGN